MTLFLSAYVLFGVLTGLWSGRHLRPDPADPIFGGDWALTVILSVCAGLAWPITWVLVVLDMRLARRWPDA